MLGGSGEGADHSVAAAAFVPLSSEQFGDIMLDYSVKEAAFGLRIKEQYSTLFGVYIPGSKGTLVSPSPIPDPSVFREFGIDAILASASVTDVQSMDAAAVKAARAFAVAMKQCLVAGSLPLVFAWDLTAAGGVGGSRRTADATSLFISRNPTPVSMFLRAVKRRFAGTTEVDMVHSLLIGVGVMQLFPYVGGPLGGADFCDDCLEVGSPKCCFFGSCCFFVSQGRRTDGVFLASSCGK